MNTTGADPPPSRCDFLGKPLRLQTAPAVPRRSLVMRHRSNARDPILPCYQVDRPLTRAFPRSYAHERGDRFRWIGIRSKNPKSTTHAHERRTHRKLSSMQVPTIKHEQTHRAWSNGAETIEIGALSLKINAVEVLERK